MALADRRRIAAALDLAVKRATIRVALSVHAELLEPPPEGTPRATGWAAANWQIAEEVLTGGALGSPENVGSARAASEATVATFAATYSGKAPGLIGNPVPYIRRLNDGWSGQSPSGFVEAAIVSGVRKA